MYLVFLLKLVVSYCLTKASSNSLLELNDSNLGFHILEKRIYYFFTLEIYSGNLLTKWGCCRASRKSGAERLFISAINSSDLYRAINISNLYAFRYNPNCLCLNKRPDQSLGTALQGNARQCLRESKVLVVIKTEYSLISDTSF